MARLHFSWRILRGPALLGGPLALVCLWGGLAHFLPRVAYGQQPTRAAYPMPAELEQIDLLRQSKEKADRKSAGCLCCHQNVHDPHFKETLHLGCVDCHGGDPTSNVKEKAHVLPRFPEAWPTSANPVRSYTLLNHESPEFIRFFNPGDLRIAHISCGTANCHPKEVLQNRLSMMTHGCMLWGSALYNNGAVPNKWARYGESYSMHGVPQRLQTYPPPTEYEMRRKGVLPYLDPLPHFEITQPGNILRIFERGGRLMYLGGNGLNCTVEYLDDGTRMRCLNQWPAGYESRFHARVESEANLLGVVFTDAGAMTVAPYEVVQPDHWAFAGTGLKAGDTFGLKTLHERYGDGASGHETDKVSPSSPKGVQILARGLNPNEGGAHLAYFETSAGGAVFSAGSITYPTALLCDLAISTMTSNVLQRFLA